MRIDRPLTLVLCMLIILAGWLGAIARGSNAVAAAGASAITLLCVAIILHHVRIPGRRIDVRSSRVLTQRDESAEFRRGLFNLCAALKLGIRFCEDHLNSDPDALTEQLGRMVNNIEAFVNEATRPVRFCERAHWPWRPRPRWPWRAKS